MGATCRLPPQLERLTAEMVHSVNLLILSNREVHAELLSRIKIDEIKRQKTDREEWERRLARWRRWWQFSSVGGFLRIG